jgi:transcriptional regulator with XRE-family HTH domain
MTPFGARIRQLRHDRGITLSAMARHLDVSPAYLSALEHGRRGAPTFAMIQSIIGFFNVIWDEAEELERLADLSHPRVVVDTAGMDPRMTALANRLARLVHRLEAGQIARLHAILDETDQKHTGPDRVGHSASRRVR